MSLRTVTPYFISNKCAQAYGKYVIEQDKIGEVITKENIIKTITTLEQYVDLRVTVTKTLPASLIDTTLNLPPGETEIHLQAHLGNVTIPPPVAPASSSKPLSRSFSDVVPVARKESFSALKLSRKESFRALQIQFQIGEI